MSQDSQLERSITWGMIPFGSSGLQVRHLALWLGVGIWAALTLVGTQLQGFICLSLNIFFLALILLATWATRTISLTKMATSFCAGGFILGVISLLIMSVPPELTNDPLLRTLAIVPIEESCKLLPVFFLLWRGRRFSTWTLGATDILLLGAASGAGFAFAQDAYVHQSDPVRQFFFVLIPAAEIVSGRLSCGGAILSSLAAGTFGLGLLFAHRRAMKLFVLPLGLILAILDHFGLDYAQMPGAAPWLVATLNFVTVNGYLAAAIFVLLLLACIGADLYVLASSLPKLKELKYFSRKDRRESIDKLWDSSLDLRKLSFAFFRWRRKPIGGDLSLTVAILAKRLVNRYNALEPTSVTVTGGMSSAGLKVNFADTGKSIVIAPENLDQPLLSRSKELAGQLPVAAQLNLPERYHILQDGSAGGMGIVYKGKDTTTGAEVAIKVMHPQHSASKTHIQRFLLEARASSTLQHPHIVSLSDFGITDRSVAWLVMEWLEGKDLEQILKRERTIKLARFLKIFSQTASALAHSHSKGIIHRDVKPSNIILIRKGEEDDFVKIVDFGLAKMAPKDGEENFHLTLTGDTVGSPMFMSPEQCGGKNLDRRSDIYSLGCVMYSALTGKPPFTAESAGQLFYKQMYEMPPRPTSLNPTLEMAKTIEPLLFKALQKEPGKRFNSMEELYLELTRIGGLVSSSGFR